MAKIVSEYVIEIEKKDKPGDRIDLRKLEILNTNVLKNYLKNRLENSQTYKEFVNLNIEKKVNEKLKKYQNEIDNKQKEKEKLENSFQLKLQKLQSEIDKVKESKIRDIEKAEIKKEKEILIDKSKEINNLNKEIALLKKEKSNEIKILEQELNRINDNKLNELEIKYKLQIQKLEDKLENKLTINSANLGQELEKHINSELENYYQDFKDTTLKFQPKAIKNTKPDWEIIFNFDNIKSKIIIDAKKQDTSTKTKKKNKDYFEKLEKDRINFNADFAILATELEEDDSFYIRKASSYENIYLVRPTVLIELLRILKIALDYKARMKNYSNQKNNDKNFAKIKMSYDELVSNILPSMIIQVNKRINEITTKAQTIKTSIDKIDKEAKSLVKDVSKSLEIYLK